MKSYIRYLVPAGCIAAGVFLGIYTLTHYELYVNIQGPGSGLMPFALSALLAIMGVVDLVKSRTRKDPVIKWQNWLIVICVAATIALSYLIGMVPSVIIFAFAWMKFKEKCDWVTILITMAVIAVLVIGVFLIWMDIPFPQGILFENLFG